IGVAVVALARNQCHTGADQANDKKVPCNHIMEGHSDRQTIIHRRPCCGSTTRVLLSRLKNNTDPNKLIYRDKITLTIDQNPFQRQKPDTYATLRRAGEP